MDTPATSWKRPASSPLNAEACQPTASVGSISPPRASRSAPTPLKILHSQVQGLRTRGGMAAQERSQHPQNRSTFLDWGGVILREMSHRPYKPPPLPFVRDTTVILQKHHAVRIIIYSYMHVI